MYNTSSWVQNNLISNLIVLPSFEAQSQQLSELCQTLTAKASQKIAYVMMDFSKPQHNW